MWDSLEEKRETQCGEKKIWEQLEKWLWKGPLSYMEQDEEQSPWKKASDSPLERHK